MEGLALCLVFCSTLATLVSVIPVLCSLILRSLRGWVIMGTPCQFALNKTPPARPNLGFTICHLSLFPLGSLDSRVIFILNPPRPVLLSVLVQPVSCRWPPGATLGWPTRRLAHPVCPENEICAAPIGICRHIRVALLV